MQALISPAEWEGIKEVLGLIIKRIEAAESLASKQIDLMDHQNQQIKALSEQMEKVPELIGRQADIHADFQAIVNDFMVNSTKLADDFLILARRVATLESGL